MTSAAYCQLMVERGRLLALFEGETPIGYLTYLLAPSVEATLAYYQRDTRFAPPEDADTDSVIYIEQLEGLRFQRSLLRQIQDVLTRRHPHWTVGVWYRLHGARWRRYTLTKQGGFNGHDVQRPCATSVRME